MRTLVSEFIKKEFSEHSAPSPLTVRRMIASGKLKGEKFGGRWYVIEDSTGDEVVDDILKRRGLA